MKREFQYPSRDGVTQIHAIEWEPEGEIHAVMQLCHGMVEFIDRYDAFAKYLNEHGIYVVGHDHLGHGKSVQNEEYHGYLLLVGVNYDKKTQEHSCKIEEYRK